MLITEMEGTRVKIIGCNQEFHVHLPPSMVDIPACICSCPLSKRPFFIHFQDSMFPEEMLHFRKSSSSSSRPSVTQTHSQIVIFFLPLQCFKYCVDFRIIASSCRERSQLVLAIEVMFSSDNIRRKWHPEACVHGGSLGCPPTLDNRVCWAVHRKVDQKLS